MWRRILYIFVVWVCFCSAANFVAAGEKQGERPREYAQSETSNTTKGLTDKKVLIFHSYRPNYRWTEIINGSLLKTLDGKNLDISTEYLDHNRQDKEARYQLMRDLFSVKYKTNPFDVIIASDDYALDFLLTHGEELFPKVPVVFCGINRFKEDLLRGRGVYTGVIEAFDIDGTVNSIFHIQSEVERIVLWGLGHKRAEANRATAIASIRKRSPDVEIVHLRDVSPAEGIQQLQGTGPETAILLLTVLRDDVTKKIYPVDRTAKTIAQGTNSPLYSLWDFFLGFGIVGGKLASGESQGRIAATMALELLAGTPVEALPVLKESPNQYMFDFKQMERFKIGKDDLPQGSIIINTKLGVFDVYGREITISLLLILIVSGLLWSWSLKQADKRTARFGQIIDKSLNEIFIFDAQTLKFVRVNHGACVNLGYKPKEMQQLTPIDIKPEINSETFNEIIKPLRDGDKEVVVFETVHQRKDGTLYNVEVHLQLMHQGKSSVFVAIIQDVTERKLLDEALKFIGQRGWKHSGQNALDSLTEFLARTLNVDYVFVDTTLNEGKTARTVSLFAGGGVQPNIEYSLKDTPCENVIGKEYCCYANHVQERFPNDALLTEMSAESYAGVPLWDSNHEPIGLVAVISNKPLVSPEVVKSVLQIISERVAYELERLRTEKELIKAKESAEEANHVKSQFLANMSHDLRTPLNAIMGFASMMEGKIFGPMGDAHYESYATDIHNSGNLLISLIDDILDLSKIEAGKYTLNETPLDVAEIIQSSVKMVSKSVEAGELQLVTVIEPNLPKLIGDERAITQVLNNLLSNSIKFTPAKGNITVSVNMRESGDLGIQVNDTGFGMAQNEITKACEPFERVDSSHSRKQEGTGLGLFLCRNLMELHGGKMEIRSEVKKGTSVTIVFPPERII